MNVLFPPRMAINCATYVIARAIPFISALRYGITIWTIGAKAAANAFPSVASEFFRD